MVLLHMRCCLLGAEFVRRRNSSDLSAEDLQQSLKSELFVLAFAIDIGIKIDSSRVLSKNNCHDFHGVLATFCALIVSVSMC